MFRRVIAAWLYVALGLLAASCVHRPTLDVLKPIGKLPSNTEKVRLLVATTRLPGSVEDRDAFGAGRSHGVNFAALTISVPPRHVLGKIEWPDAIPGDPNKHFVVVDRASLSRDQFLERVEETPGGALEAGSILVFVHGYNTLYQEAVYRFAQIVHDSGYQGTAVLFAWPSLGKAPLYLADRDASTYSRDHLEKTLIEMASRQGAKEINLLAHSMGTWLAVEALRQARMSKRAELMSKLGDVNRH